MTFLSDAGAVCAFMAGTLYLYVPVLQYKSKETDLFPSSEIQIL
jgi:hypothetical protein